MCLKMAVKYSVYSKRERWGICKSFKMINLHIFDWILRLDTNELKVNWILLEVSNNRFRIQFYFVWWNELTSFHRSALRQKLQLCLDTWSNFSTNLNVFPSSSYQKSFSFRSSSSSLKNQARLLTHFPPNDSEQPQRFQTPFTPDLVRGFINRWAMYSQKV